MTNQNILVDRLLNENPQNWCPNLKRDNQGPYCGNLLDNEVKRLVCCPTSLQLYCLVPERHATCIYNPQPKR